VRRLGGFGQRRGFRDGVVRPRVIEFLADGCRPQPGDDVQLFGQPVEALGQRGERDRICLMFCLEPARTDTQFDTATAHFVDLGDRDRQRARVAEGRRGDHRAEPDRRRLARDAGQRHPGVGRTW
jgi:hypothetical protein